MPFDPNSYNKTPDDPERDIKRENGSKTLAAIEAANKAAVDRYKKAVEQYNEGLKENERLKAELARLEGDAPDSAPGADPNQAPAPDQEPTPDAAPDQAPVDDEDAPWEEPPLFDGDDDDEDDEDDNPVPESEPHPESDSIMRRFNKIKMRQAVKSALTSAAAVAAGVTIGLLMNLNNISNIFSSSKNAAPDQTPTEPESISDTMAPAESTDDLEIMEAIGIRDGYDEYGMWLSEHKSFYANFACASEVSEVCDNDEVEMVKYTAGNQVESFADYLANLPEELQPEKFRGLSIIETERYLESLSDEEFDGIRQRFEGIMDKAMTRRADKNGKFNNAYMRLTDPNGSITHDNMELVRCTTYEDHKEYIEFYWLDDDGNEIGSMSVRVSRVYDADGNIIGHEGCMQVITPSGTSIYEGLPEIPDPDTPDPGTTTTTDPETPYTPIIEWGKSGDPHGGEDVEISDQVDPKSEVSEEQNNSTNTGNQGYVYDHGATPGTANDTDSYWFAGSGIQATDANTDGGRLHGGEDQSNNGDGGSDMAGENAYQNPEAIAEGEAINEAGNNAQAEAQEFGGSDNGGSTPGGDNYGDKDEEDIVAEGDY